MFTPLPTDAVALTAVTPDPATARRETAARLAGLADALTGVVPVLMGSTWGAPGSPDGAVALGPTGDGSEADAAGDAATGGAALAVAPRTPGEVADVVRAARAHGVPVAVRAGGRGTGTVPDGAVLVSTAALDHVTILPVLARAHVGPGVRWDDLVATAASFGLAPVVPRAPVALVGDLVGAGDDDGRVGRSPGGVRALDVVTPDGQLRRATPTDSPDLFRALHAPGAASVAGAAQARGDAPAAGRAPGVVVAVEVDLVETTAP